MVLDIETSGLDLKTSQIYTVGLKWSPSAKDEALFWHTDERALLQNFWRFFRSNFDPAWCDFVVAGFNIHHFDLPLLVNRTAQHELPRGPPFQTLDLMTVLFADGAQRQSLASVCAQLGIPKNNGVSGRDVPGLWQRQDYSQIINHCLDDIRCEYNLLEKLRERGEVKGK